MILVQPPLPGLAKSQLAMSGMDGARTAEIVVSTDRWVKSSVPINKSRMRAMWVEVHTPERGTMEAEENERWWPGGNVPWSVGFWLEAAEMVISTEEVWGS